jgi:hypothetical protein
LLIDVGIYLHHPNVGGASFSSGKVTWKFKWVGGPTKYFVTPKVPGQQGINEKYGSSAYHL